MKDKKLVFLTTGHSAFDDRIFYHFAKSLSDYFEVSILCSNADLHKTVDGISVIGEDHTHTSKKGKSRFFEQQLQKINPEIMICAEPLAVYAAWCFKKSTGSKGKILYDITEWVPSKKNLEGLFFIKKCSVYLNLLVFNIYAASKCHGFIFGEHYKSLPYRRIFPFKKWVMVPYYPDLKYIIYKASTLSPGKFCLGYTGRISIEKGIAEVFKVANQLKTELPSLEIKLKIIGWTYSETDRHFFDQLLKTALCNVEVMERVPFEEFSVHLQDMDVLFDLREKDWENNRCLPIKLFYYAACGKPLVYSDLKAIRKVMDGSQIGLLSDPLNTNLIVVHLKSYLQNPELYQQHGQTVRDFALTRFNWEKILPDLLTFIHQL